jgi:CheY-like chemotaxis protein
MNETGVGKAIEILLIEDDKEDVLLTREALKAGKVNNVLHVVEDGEQALDFLRRGGRYADAPSPDLILLDLNLPGMSGREILVEIKKDPALRVIPVVILTTSDADDDILESYKRHANCYIHKPVDLKQFMHVVGQVKEFWLSIVKLPPK